MRNVLFSLRTGALLPGDLGLATLLGTIGLRATAERQMRPEFVRDHLPCTAIPRMPRGFGSQYRRSPAEKDLG